MGPIEAPATIKQDKILKFLSDKGLTPKFILDIIWIATNMSNIFENWVTWPMPQNTCSDFSKVFWIGSKDKNAIDKQTREIKKITPVETIPNLALSVFISKKTLKNNLKMIIDNAIVRQDKPAKKNGWITIGI